MADDASLALTPAVPTPGHAPDTLVVDVDLFKGPGRLAGPHGRVLDLVENAPAIFWLDPQAPPVFHDSYVIDLNSLNLVREV